VVGCLKRGLVYGEPIPGAKTSGCSDR